MGIHKTYAVSNNHVLSTKVCENGPENFVTKESSLSAVDISRTQTVTKPSGFQHRYLVACLLGLNFFFINMTRSCLSVGMTAMLNHTHDTSSLNVSIRRKDECDFHLLSNATAQRIAPKLEGEFDWSPQVQGSVLGMSYVGYVLGLIPSGSFSQKLGGKRVATGGLLLFGLGCTLSPVAARIHYAVLLVAQFFTGIGHAAILPAFATLASNWFPKCERSFFNPLILNGYSIGSVVGNYVAGLIAESETLGGWASAFYIFGILTLVDGILNLFLLYDIPKVHPRIKKSELLYILQNQESELPQKRPPTPWKKILTSVPVWATIAAFFAQGWLATHAIVLYAPFAGIILNYSPSESGLYASILFILATVLGILSGYIANWIQTKGYIGVDKLRKGCQLLVNLIYSAGLVGVCLSGCDRSLINILSIICLGLPGIAVSGVSVAPMDMSPMFAGTIMSLCALFGLSAGFIFPFVAGVMTKSEQTLRQWYKIFGLSIGLTTGIGILYFIFGSANVQPWNFPEGFEHEDSNKTSTKEEKKPENLENQLDVAHHL